MSSKRTTGAATLRDIAERVGVSAMTVSVVLNGTRSSARVAEGTRSRILLAAEELGYKRNGSMLAARTGRFGSVALLMSTNAVRSRLPTEMWDGIHDELAAHNLHLILNKLPDATLENQGKLPKILREWLCDGLLVDVTHEISPNLVAAIEDSGVPSVWINTMQEADCVYPDDRGAGAQAGQRLLQGGCQKVVYVGYENVINDTRQHYSLAARRDGAFEVLKKAGVETWSAPRPEYAEYQAVYLDDMRFWQQYLAGATQPHGVIAYSSYQAAPLLEAASSLGLRVPEDISLVTFGDAEEYIGGKCYSSFLVPSAEVGRRAAQMLQRKIAFPTQRQASEAVKFSAVVGQTCRISPL